jgi:uridine phosphorylase
MIEEYRHLNVLNFEMECGTLFKMGSVYGFATACICGIIANRTTSENVSLELKQIAVENAIKVAVRAAEDIYPYPNASSSPTVDY